MPFTYSLNVDGDFRGCMLRANGIYQPHYVSEGTWPPIRTLIDEWHVVAHAGRKRADGETIVGTLSVGKKTPPNSFGRTWFARMPDFF